MTPYSPGHAPSGAAELSSQSPEGAYANWAQGEVDVYLQRAGGTQPSQIRLVVKRRVLKNANEL